MRRLHLTFAFLLAAPGATGCASPPEVDVRLVHSSALVPEGAFSRLTVNVLELDGGRSVHSGTVSMDVLGAKTELFDAGRLRAGTRYVVTVEAEAMGVCRLGRAVGRSVPFEHREGGYPVPVQIGCADEMTPTRQRPTVARAAHSMATASDGRAVVVGGARTVSLTDAIVLEPENLQPIIEHYDPATGHFVPGGSLTAARLAPAVVPVPDGGVAVFGGVVRGLPICEPSVELAVGLSTASIGRLATPRCFPSAAHLPGANRIVVVGGSGGDDVGDRGRDGEAFLASAREGAQDRIAGNNYRFWPAIVPLSDGLSALVVGGVVEDSPEPVVEILRVGGRCGAGSACMTSVPMEGAPETGLGGASATWAPCDDGGGAVYVFGGTAPAVGALGDVWCYRDEPFVDGSLVRAGRLPQPRNGAVVQTVDGPGFHRALLIGGVGVDSEVYEDALLIPMDGCGCAPVQPEDVESIPVPIDGLLVFHRATSLHDGSALMVGGVRVMLGDEDAEATGEAALFIPDLP